MDRVVKASIFVSVFFGIQTSFNAVQADDLYDIYTSIYWSDGDSGKLGDTKFRLANVDAPETRSMKQVGGAKCEAEREIGYEAKAFLVSFTKNKEIRIVKSYGLDRYERLVVDLEADGESVSDEAIASGFLKPWPHKKGRKLLPKPDWCEPR